MSLKDRTVSAVGWSLLAGTSQKVLRFVLGIVLARLLGPTEFGLIGMILVFTGFAEVFKDLGFSAALVQREQIDEHHKSSVFWLTVSLGLLLGAVTYLSAPLVAGFYGEPRLQPLTRILSVNFVLGSLAAVQTALLTRTLNFKALALREMGGVSVGAGVAIGLAMAGFGVWSLVAEVLVTTAVGTVLIWSVSEWRPSLRFRAGSIRELWAFSSNLAGFRFLNYWVRNADNLLIGKFVGSSGLGIYSRAYTTMQLPLAQVTTLLGRVMFPALSKIQGDPQRTKQVYLRAARAIGLVTIPMMCGLFVVAEAFVVGLFGPQWRDVTVVLQVLCLVGVMQPVNATTGWIFMSAGRTDLQLRWALVTGTVALIAFAVGIRWGVMGVAVAYVVRGYLIWYPAISIPGSLIGLRFSEYVRNLAGIAACALLMTGTLWSVAGLLPDGLPELGQLGIQTLIGMGTYLIVLHVFRVQAYLEVREILSDRLRRPGGHSRAGGAR